MMTVYEKPYSARTETPKMLARLLALVEKGYAVTALDDRGGTGCFVLVIDLSITPDLPAPRGFDRRYAAGRVSI